MKALPKVPVTWNWSGVRSNVDDRSILPGELTQLVNWRRTVEGRLQKRFGNNKTTISSFSGGTYAGPTIDVTPSDAVILRDTSDQLFVRNPTDGVGYYRGIDLRAHPTWKGVENLSSYGGSNKPLAVQRAGGDIFHFTLGVTGSGGTGYQVTVLDGATGVVKVRPAFRLANGIVAYSAVVDATDQVWIIYLTSADTDAIYMQRLNSLGAIATTNSVTVASHTFTDVKARLLVNGEVAIVATSQSTSGADMIVKHYHAYLSTPNGNVKGSPAAVSTSYTSAPHATDARCAGGVGIAESAADASFWYYAFWRTKVDGDIQMVRIKVALTTLVISTTVELEVRDLDPTASMYIGASAGYVVAGGTEAWFGGVNEYDGSDGAIDSRVAYVNRIIYTGSATVSLFARSAYLASDVFTVGTSRYVLTGHDDMHDIGNYGAQRGYFVRNSAGKIVSTVLDGVGGQIFYNAGIKPTGRYSNLDLHDGHTIAPVVVGNKVYLALLQAGSTEVSHEPVLATVDFAPTWDSKAPDIIPGGVPKTVSAADPVTELAPIHYPWRSPEVGNNGSAGTTQSRNHVAYLYCTVNAAGEITRSAPSTTAELTFENYVVPSNDYVVRVGTLLHAIGPIWIELYVSENLETGSDTALYLARRVPNDPTVDSIDIPLVPFNFVAGSGALLETTNLAVRLENGSVPPSRLAAYWRDRLFMAGTPEDDVIYSQEKRPGCGYEFNEALSVVWQDGSGPITAICPLSFDALVIFRKDAIGIITGPGPTPAGPAVSSNYIVQTLSFSKGTTNPKSVVQGPAGVYFMNASDGRPHVITSGGGVSEISQGYESYLAQVPVASVHDVAQRCVRWYMSSGKQIKLDYSKPFGDQAAGQWMEDNNSNLPAAVGAVAINNVAVMVEAGTAALARTWQAGTGFTDDGTAVLTDMTSGRMAPAGLLGEFDLDEFHVSSTRLGGDSAYAYTLTNDQGATEPHPDVASNTADVWFRSSLFRTREFRIRIQETSATGEGRSFDGLAAIVRPYGSFQNPYRRIG